MTKTQSTQDRSIDLTKEGGILFKESDHSYFNDKGERYIGVTTLLSNYHEHFDTEKTSLNKAIKNCVINYYGKLHYQDLFNNEEYEKIQRVKHNMQDYLIFPIVCQAIKDNVIKEHGEENYLKLEEQCKGFDNLYFKLEKFERKPELYAKIYEDIDIQATITHYGLIEYKKLTLKCNGFDNLYTQINKIKSKTPDLYSLIIFEQDKLKDEWEDKNKKAIHEGSLDHDKREQKIYDDGGYEFEGVFYKYIEGKNITNVTIDDVIVIPECMVWNHEMKLGGLADIFLFNKGTIHVLDYKTNESIDTEPKIKIVKFWKYMLGPCKDLLDLNYYHYSLQLNIYQFMALMIREEFKPGKRIIIHTSSKTHYRDHDVFYNCYSTTHIVPEIFKDILNK